MDDEPGFLHLIPRVLRDLGCKVVTASDGGQALEIAAQQTIHLLITDVFMDGMNGFELTMAMRDRPAYADLPIIILSDRSQAKCGTIDLHDDITFLMAKPFSPTEMRGHIKDILGLS